MGNIVKNFRNNAESTAKNVGKKALKETAKMVAKLALKGLMLLLNNPIGWIVIILFIIVCAFSSTDTAEASTTVSTVYSALGFSEGTNNFVGLVEIKSNEAGSYWSFKSDIDEKITKIIQSLRSTTGTYNIKDEELTKKMIKAELVTTLPNLGGTPPAEDINSFQGIVNLQGLTYISQSEFENKISTGSEDVVNYFSVNSGNANVLIANAGSSKEINLQSTVVSKYSTPFEYLLYLLMCSDEEEFIVALSDNVLNSYINITLSSSDVKVNEAYTWCVKITSDGNGNAVVDSSGSGENSMFSKLYNEYKLKSKMSTNRLFKYVEQNSKSQKLSEMTKYLIYTATGQEIDDVKNYDFSGFTQSSVNNVSSLGGLATFKEFLHIYEGHEGISEDGTMYMVGPDPVGIPTVGYGVNLKAHGSKFTNAGYSIEIGSYIPVEVVDAVEDELIQDRIKQIEANYSQYNLTNYQKYALLMRSYNYNLSGFEEKYLQYWNQETDDEYGVMPNDNIFEHPLYKNYMCKPVTGVGNPEPLPGLIERRKAEWILFKTGYYKDLGVFCTENDTDDFLAVAKNVWTTVCNGNYSYGGSSVPCTGTTIDCSSYVSWVLLEYGYTDYAGVQHNTTNFLNDDLTGKYGWEVIPVEAGENPINKLQAGDLLVRTSSGGHSAHITLVVDVQGNKTIGYDCGSEKNWANNTNGDPINTSWFLTHPGAGKIIRVKSPN